MTFGIAHCTGDQPVRTKAGHVQPDPPAGSLRAQHAAIAADQPTDRLSWPRACLIIATVSLVAWGGVWAGGSWLLGY